MTAQKTGHSQKGSGKNSSLKGTKSLSNAPRASDSSTTATTSSSDTEFSPSTSVEPVITIAPIDGQGKIVIAGLKTNPDSKVIMTEKSSGKAVKGTTEDK